MRWKAIIPTILVVALINVMVIFFLDGWVKSAIEKVGTTAYGARIDLDKVDISFKNLRVTLYGLQVTDKDNPMTNALDIKKMQFDLEGKPLSWKKVIIENAEISDIRTGTPRKKSGAISKKLKKKRKSTVKTVKETSKKTVSFTMTNLKKEYDPQKLVQLENLGAYKKIKEESVRLPSLAEKWEKKLDVVKTEQLLKDIKAFVERTKSSKYSGLAGVTLAANQIKEATRLQKEVKKVSKDFKELKTTLEKEIREAKNTLKEVDRLKGADINGFLGRLKSSFSAQGMTRGIIGGQWFSKLKEGIAWSHKIREMVPQKKEGAKPPPPPPRLGKDIHFPFRYQWPNFHLKKAQVSGATSSDRPLMYSGTIKDVTSQPKKLGKPIALDIKGDKKDGPELLTLKATLDYTQEESSEKLNMAYSGIRLKGLDLGTVGAPISIEKGTGKATLQLKTKQEKIAGNINFVADPIRLKHTLSKEQSREKFLQILHDVLMKLNRADAHIKVSHKITSPRFKLKSSLDKEVNQAVKQVLQKEIADLKNQFRQRVNELVNKEKKKLTDLIDTKVNGVTQKILKKNNLIEANKKELQKSLEKLKKEAKRSLPSLGGGSSGNSDDKNPTFKNIKKDLKNIFKKK